MNWNIAQIGECLWNLHQRVWCLFSVSWSQYWNLKERKMPGKHKRMKFTGMQALDQSIPLFWGELRFKLEAEISNTIPWIKETLAKRGHLHLVILHSSLILLDQKKQIQVILCHQNHGNFPISSILSTLHKKAWPFSYSSRHVFLSGILCRSWSWKFKTQQSFLFSAYWSTRNRKRWIKNKLCIRPACVNWFPVYEIYSKVN